MGVSWWQTDEDLSRARFLGIERAPNAAPLLQLHRVATVGPNISVYIRDLRGRGIKTERDLSQLSLSLFPSATPLIILRKSF